MTNNKKVGLVAVSILALALFSSGAPLSLLNQANALQFIITIPAGRNAGRQVAIVTINNPNAVQAIIAHSNSLQPQATLSVSPLSVVLNTTTGVNPGDPVVTIANTGPTGSVLNWTAAASAPWIGLSQASGTVSAGSSTAVIVGADVVGMGVGTYNGTITISDLTAPTALNSPQSVAVTLNITAPPPPPVIQQLDHGTQIGTAVDQGGRQLVVVPATMSISAVAMWLAPVGGPVNHSDSYLAIFADSSGAPGNQVATSSVLSISQFDSGGDHSYSFATPVTLAPGSYWLEPMPAGGNGTAIYGSFSNPYAGGYWLWPPDPRFSSLEDAYFRLVTL